MYLNTVSIRNYRCFEQLDISLHERLTLFVGKNGAGKTTVLDAIAVAASTFLCGIEGVGGRTIDKEDQNIIFMS